MTQQLNNKHVIDKDFCLNSYIAFRYIYKDNVDFFEGLEHKNFDLSLIKERKAIKNVDDINDCIQQQIDSLYKKYNKVGILLSGGMDSAIIASYLKSGSYSYTFCNDDTRIYDLDIERASYYSKKLGLIQRKISITFDDYKKYTPIVMKYKGAPVHSIEPQIYKAAIQAKKDGCEIMLIGDGADYVFGGMDGLLSRDWKYKDFINRYMSLDPKKVLKKIVDVTDLFKPYRVNNNIDFVSFINGPMTVESYSSYQNAFFSANMPYLDPYEKMYMVDKLDLERIRNGESKYLIRELFKLRYPELDIPKKIPMPRPVDFIFSDWDGPVRQEFKKNIDMNSLTGNQKWQLWCAEQFLNIYEKNK